MQMSRIPPSRRRRGRDCEGVPRHPRAAGPLRDARSAIVHGSEARMTSASPPHPDRLADEAGSRCRRDGDIARSLCGARRRHRAQPAASASAGRPSCARDALWTSVLRSASSSTSPFAPSVTSSVGVILAHSRAGAMLPQGMKRALSYSSPTARGPGSLDPRRDGAIRQESGDARSETRERDLRKSQLDFPTTRRR